MVFNFQSSIQDKQKDKQIVFLAGSVATDSDNNWRHDIINKWGDEYHFFDPVNPNHANLNDKDMRAHIKWELDALKSSDYIFLNLLPTSTSPISLVEMGLYVSTKKLIVICPTEFYKWRYIDVLCKEYNTPIFQDFGEALNGNRPIDILT
ncbi:MAG: hypothetical protein ACJAUD_000612 [Crocinitomicaceae bacterium]|jgi:hypothetical protein